MELAPQVLMLTLAVCYGPEPNLSHSPRWSQSGPMYTPAAGTRRHSLFPRLTMKCAEARVTGDKPECEGCVLEGVSSSHV